MSWQIAVLVVAVFTVSLLARKASPRFRYLLWALILLKLCLPPSLAFVTGAGRWLPVTQTPLVMNETITSLPMMLASEPLAPLADVAAAGPSAPALPVILLAIWLAGVLVMVALLVIQYGAIRRPLSGAEQVEDRVILKVFREACERLGFSKMPGIGTGADLLCADGLSSPILFGLFRPRIVLPGRVLGDLGAEQIRPIMLHELAHLRRRDLWMNWVQVLLQTIYWFHPLVWLANVRLRREREMIVDDLVLAHMDGKREVYGSSLVRVAKGAMRSRLLAPGLVGIIEKESTMKRRLKRILGNRSKRSPRLGAGSMLILAILALVLIPLAHPTNAEDKATPKAADETAALFKRAYDAFARGEHAQASEAAAKVLELEPNNVAAKVLRDMATKPTKEESAREALLMLRVDLSFIDTPLSDVIDFLSAITKEDMVLDKRTLETTERLIDVHAKDVRLKAALDLILHLASTREELTKGDPLTYGIRATGIYIGNKSMLRLLEENSRERELKGKRVNLVFENTALRDVIGMLAASTGENITLDKKIAKETGRRVTVSLKGVSLNNAIRKILRKTTKPDGKTLAADDLGYVIDGKSIFISDKRTLARMRKNR